MKSLILALVGSSLAQSLCLQLSAIPMTITANYNPNVTILDGDLNGVADTHSLSTSIQTITDVQVTLDIAGGYNGDLYAYLQHGGSGFAVLLNRVGRTSGNIYGSSGSGFSVTLADSAATDIHLAPGSGTLSGTYQPDGRNTSPFSVLDTTPRTALLDAFNGMDPNGDWTLFVADTSSVGISTLQGWGLQITGDVPNSNAPETADTLGLLSLSVGALWLVHRKGHAAPREA